jgi:conjugal transfer pilus assembly protein TraB
MNINEQWNKLDAKVKRYVYVGGILLGIILIFTLLSPDASTYRRKKSPTIEHLLTDTDTSKVTLQGLAAKYDSSKTADKKMLRMIDQIQADINELGVDKTPNRKVQQELSELKAKFVVNERKMQQAMKRVEELEENGVPVNNNVQYRTGSSTENGSISSGAIPIIPSMNALEDSATNNRVDQIVPQQEQIVNNGQQESSMELYASAEEFFKSAPVASVGSNESGTRIIGPSVNNSSKPTKLSIRSISSDGSGTVTKKARKVKKQRTARVGEEVEDKGLYIPAGAMIESVVIAGMDAPTSKSAKRDPFPALMRFKKEAILPNRFKADIRECFLIVSGYGSLSSERAYFRGETLSCINEDGTSLEARFDSFAVGEDGKTGVRGRLVTKAGAVIGRAMLAGFGQGLSKAFDVSAVPTISTSDSSAVQFQDVLSGDSLQSAAVGGVGSALGKVADYYLELADELTPVIEIDAGRVINFIVTKGMYLQKRN